MANHEYKINAFRSHKMCQTNHRRYNEENQKNENLLHTLLPFILLPLQIKFLNKNTHI